MLKALTLTMIFVMVLCDDKADENVITKGEAQNSTITNTTTAKPTSWSNSNAESVSEGLKAVTDGAKQIISGVWEVGSGILNAITRWFDGDQ